MYQEKSNQIYDEWNRKLFETKIIGEGKLKVRNYDTNEKINYIQDKIN